MKELLASVFGFGPETSRPQEAYGGRIVLSVQASAAHYSDPKVTGLPLEQYKSVEVGLLYKGHLVRPSAIGIKGFDDAFEDGSSPVAPYVSQEWITALREQIKARGADSDLI